MAVRIAALCVLLLAAPAHAYCRRSVCDGRAGTACVPARADDCGTPARWPSGCVAFSLADDGALAAPAALAVMTTAFATWMAADCGYGQHPGLRVRARGPVACDRHEYNRDGGNANVIAFHGGAWPYGDGVGELALTSLSYDARDATILDADIEFHWRELAGMDLPLIALHEAGHFLGLAHSDDPASVMTADVHAGATAPHALSADDARAVCALFPPGAMTCDDKPRGGLRRTCGGAVAAGDQRADRTDHGPDRAGADPADRAGGSRAWPWWLGLAGLAAAGALWRWRVA